MELTKSLIKSESEIQEEKNKSADHIYYNATIFNNTADPNGQGTAIPAIYREVRSDPLVSKPEDWFLTVVRMKIPLDNVPLFYFDNVSFTAIGQSDSTTAILDHFPQVLNLVGVFNPLSATISNIEDPTGITTNLSGLRVGPQTKIYTSSSSSSKAPMGLIHGDTYIISSTSNSIFMSTLTSASVPAGSRFSFTIDTASGFGEVPVANFSTLATINLQSFSPSVPPGTLNPTGAVVTDASGAITLQDVTTTQLIRESKSSSTHLWPPGESITVVSTPFNISLVYPAPSPGPSNTYSALVIPSAVTVGDAYLVFSVQEFIDQVNAAFLEAFTNLVAANPGFPAANAPYVFFNPVTQLFGIVCEQGAFYPNNLSGAQIYMSPLLFRFFQNFISGEFVPNVGYPIFMYSLGSTAEHPS